MRSYKIQGEIDIEALDKYLRANYPTKVLSSAKNVLVFKIFGFYKLLPMTPLIFNEAVVSIKHFEKTDLTTVKFSILTTFYLYILFLPLIISFIAANGCRPENFFEFSIFFFIFYPIMVVPGLLWAWFKQKRLISILSKKT